MLWPSAPSDPISRGNGVRWHIEHTTIFTASSGVRRTDPESFRHDQQQRTRHAFEAVNLAHVSSKRGAMVRFLVTSSPRQKSWYQPEIRLLHEPPVPVSWGESSSESSKRAPVWPPLPPSSPLASSFRLFHLRRGVLDGIACSPFPPPEASPALPKPSPAGVAPTPKLPYVDEPGGDRVAALKEVSPSHALAPSSRLFPFPLSTSTASRGGSFSPGSDDESPSVCPPSGPSAKRTLLRLVNDAASCRAPAFLARLDLGAHLRVRSSCFWLLSVVLFTAVTTGVELLCSCPGPLSTSWALELACFLSAARARRTFRQRTAATCNVEIDTKVRRGGGQVVLRFAATVL